MSDKYTYVVLGKKTFEDLQTGKLFNKYEVYNVTSDQNEAYEDLFGYDGIYGSQINKITSNGILKVVDSRVVTFEGNRTKQQAEEIINKASQNENNIEIVWSRGRR